MEDRLSKLSFKEKIGYGIGDAGFNFYWVIIGSYLSFFYTDIFGISAAAAGTMFLVTRIVDACTDPLMGAIADRTNTRWGKFRPYLLFGAIPMAGAAVLTMTTPDLDEGGKVLWAYGTYALMMVCYTILSTPYSSLAGVITADPDQRNSIFGIRFFFAFTVGTIVGLFTPGLANSFATEGDIASGWQMTMALYAGVATILFWITFATTKERVTPPAGQKTKPINDIKDLLKNKPWLILFALAMIIMMTIVFRGSSATYYFKYFVERPDLMGPYIGVQMAAYAIGCLAVPYVARVITDKAKLLIILMSIVGVLSIGFAFVPKPDRTGVVTLGQDALDSATWPKEIVIMFILNALISLALGPKSPITWSMYADAADYNEWKTGRRATAMTFSAATFSQKLGGALGSAGVLWVLASVGYAANQAQEGASLESIVWLQTLVPAFFAFVAVAALKFYDLSSSKLAQIQLELKQRNA